jgi:hypothetical protein
MDYALALTVPIRFIPRYEPIFHPKTGLLPSQNPEKPLSASQI